MFVYICYMFEMSVLFYFILGSFSFIIKKVLKKNNNNNNNIGA